MPEWEVENEASPFPQALTGRMLIWPGLGLWATWVVAGEKPCSVGQLLGFMSHGMAVFSFHLEVTCPEKD